ncbi:MAG: cobyrinate a,c-diamide synthase [Kiloniellales bacterium]
MSRGLIVAAPASGSGKSTLTLGLLRQLRNSGMAVAGAKVGPDYIDPGFHAAASGRPCLNLESWAMRPALLRSLLHEATREAELVVVEGVMGLFDGAADGTGSIRGSTAEIARLTGWPVVLVIDARGMAASAAALLRGFITHDPALELAGVVFNRVGGGGHGAMLRQACAGLGPLLLGALPRTAGLGLPERHLGLVQASEHGDLEAFLERSASLVAQHLDVAGLVALAKPLALDPGSGKGELSAPIPPPLPPLGQRIAVARDEAFGFLYPFVAEGWRRAGAEVSFFSPLDDEPPDAAADAVYLPGGYPELHPGRLAGNVRFLDGLRAAAARGAVLYGECGGYMVMGRTLVDGEGRGHAMAGLLPVETSFAEPRLTLGYRRASLVAAGPLGAAGQAFRGHEFHFARRLGEAGLPLFACRDASGQTRGRAGTLQGRVMGSFVHLVDREETADVVSSAGSGDVPAQALVK